LLRDLVSPRFPLTLPKATANAQESIAWGTNIVGGVTPGKDGEHLGRPVLPTVREVRKSLINICLRLLSRLCPRLWRSSSRKLQGYMLLLIKHLVPLRKPLKPKFPSSWPSQNISLFTICCGYVSSLRSIYSHLNAIDPFYAEDPVEISTCGRQLTWDYFCYWQM
jgi:hypothetical protein